MKDEIIGLSIVKDYVLKCGDCGTPLVNIILTETNEQRLSRGDIAQKTKYKATGCFKCGGNSFESPLFEGSSIIGPIKSNYEVYITDVDVNDDMSVQTATITVGKVK